METADLPNGFQMDNQGGAGPLHLCRTCLPEIPGPGAVWRKGAPEDMDIDDFNESEVPSIQDPPAVLLELFKQVRIDTLHLTETMQEGDLDRIATHPWFEDKEIRWYLKLLYRHNTMHRMDISKVLRSGEPILPSD